jgi:hypothetical protein
MMPTLSYQKRLVYLIFASLLLVLAINLMSLYQIRQQVHQQNMQVPLQLAQLYLLRYAKQQGSLPCADGNGDGYSDTIQTSTITIDTSSHPQSLSQCQYPLGWLPDKTIQQPELRDEEGQRFWYTKAVNADQRLQINGHPIAIAVLISAGPAMPWQKDRRPHSDDPLRLPLQPDLYLEASNAQRQWQDFSSLGSINNNDRLTWIPHHDWPSTL